MMHDRNIYCYQLISSTFEHRSSRDLISDTRRMWMLRMINDIDILLSSNKVVLIVYFIESDVDVLNPLDLGWKKKTFGSS